MNLEYHFFFLMKGMDHELGMYLDKIDNTPDL